MNNYYLIDENLLLSLLEDRDKLYAFLKYNDYKMNGCYNYNLKKYIRDNSYKDFRESAKESLSFFINNKFIFKY